MRIRHLSWDGDPDALAARIRAEDEIDEELIDRVAEIAEAVRTGGDAALLDLVDRLDGARPPAPLVEAEELRAALARTPDPLCDALTVAADNIRTVAEAQLGVPVSLTMPQGHCITTSQCPLPSAAAYVPGGRAAYPSTVLMCAIPAQVAGVERVAVVSPPGSDGALPDSVLAACAIAGVDEVYAAGGAQGIAALAFGTETIEPVDAIVGPGNRWVQEAKQLVSRYLRIDGYAGPSELMVLLDDSVPGEWVAADLCAQAEHGADTLLVAVAVTVSALDGLEEAVQSIAAAERSVAPASLTLVKVLDLEQGVSLADALAPEHLQLSCAGAGELAKRASSAGCVFAGAAAATAFGDYAAGSNHVLPTGGTGRFTSPLSPATFMRPISTVEIDEAAAAKLAPAVDVIARAEGFPVHGESTLRRSRTERPADEER